MAPPKTTPMMQQYLSIKGQYPDAILFYRMGDFYEMFFEDAQLASKILDITLTSRNKNNQTPIPMCGVPCKAAQGYIAKLIDSGQKVAVCEQVEDPSTSKGLVKREVVRVITPGMVIDDTLLDQKTNNYVLAIVLHKIAGIAYVDISTGQFRITQSKEPSAVVEECLRIDPSEVILPECSKQDARYASIMQALETKSIGFLSNSAFEYPNARETLLRQFNMVSLESFGCENLKEAVAAAGALISYVQDTQKNEIKHIQAIKTYRLNDYLWLDDLTIRNLELIKSISKGSRQGTLIGVLDRTRTPMGSRLLLDWLYYPQRDVRCIEKRFEAVQELKDTRNVRLRLLDTFKSVTDIERLGSKITMGQCNARDLVSLRNTIEIIPSLVSALEEAKAELLQLQDNFENLASLATLIRHAIREDAPPTVHEGGMIKKGYDPKLDELVKISRNARDWLAQLEITEREATGITALKVRFNKVFGYFIEVPKSRSAHVPARYVRKQTLVNAERYITEELKDFEYKVLNAEEQRAKIEFGIFEEIRKEAINCNAQIQQLAQNLATLDCLVNFAEIADRNNYRRPTMNSEGVISITDGRHPVVEKMISGERFVPNSIYLDNDHDQILVITGPNMAGKSTVLRQTALLVIMTHMGSFIPVRDASIALTDRIFTRVGALDNLSQGQSTFMVEMQETANILNHATSQSLVVMDEIGRGTSTFDGLSIAWAVAAYLHDLDDTGVKTLFATHYHELTELALTKPKVRNHHIAVKEWNDEIIFLRKMVPGGTNRSYGIQVARLAGLPGRVIRQAKKVLAVIEQGGEHIKQVHTEIEKDENIPSSPMQMNLFEISDHPAVKRLNQIDIANTTPLEALNYLNELLDLTKT